MVFPMLGHIQIVHIGIRFPNAMIRWRNSAQQSHGFHFWIETNIQWKHADIEPNKKGRVARIPWFSGEVRPKQSEIHWDPSFSQLRLRVMPFMIPWEKAKSLRNMLDWLTRKFGNATWSKPMIWVVCLRNTWELKTLIWHDEWPPKWGICGEFMRILPLRWAI